MNINKKQIHKIYSKSYSIVESRGKERQNIINEVTIELLKSTEKYKDCIFKTEERIYNDILWGSYFTVDITIYREEILTDIVLVKAPASNIVQNKVNSLNAKFGEIGRLLNYINNGVKVTFINFQPNISPFFDNSGDIKHFENNKVEGIKTAISLLNPNIDFSELFITFDIVGIDNCKNKSDIKDLMSSELVVDNINLEI